MAKTDFKTIDEYIATLPTEVQAILQQVRQVIKAAVPAAEEVISYQIPAFTYHGWLFYISAHKQHFSISCPPPSAAFEAFKAELASYKQSKSAIQFPLDQPVPVDLLYQMAQVQASANEEKAKATPAKKKRAVE